MTIKTTRVSVPELLVVRVKCPNQDCSASTEMTIKQLAGIRSPIQCAACQTSLQDAPPNNQLTDFAHRLIRLSESYKGSVEFVIPAEE